MHRKTYIHVLTRHTYKTYKKMHRKTYKHMLPRHTYKTYKKLHRKTYIQDIQTPSLYVCFATLFVCLGGVDCTFVCLANGCLAMQSSCMYVLRCITSWQDTVTLHGKTGGCLVCMSCHVSTFTDVCRGGTCQARGTCLPCF